MADGANPNHLIGGDPLIMRYVHNVVGTCSSIGNIPLDCVQLLIELGADPNLTVGGRMNLLQDAIISENVELVRLLLRAGTYPNCIDFQTSESLLDWIEYDIDFEESQGNDSSRLRNILTLLKGSGARSISELHTSELEERVTINENYLTGLITKKGNIHIEQIPGANHQLISQFHSWLSTSQHRFVSFNERQQMKIDRNKLRLHNEQGLDCVSRIKTLLTDDIKLTYFAYDAEGVQITPFYFDIAVMSDFLALFWSDGSCIGSAGENPGNHSISNKLKSEFIEWHSEFEKQGGEDHHSIDWNRYNARGRELTAKLQAELGSTVNVKYQDPFESKENRDTFVP